MGKVKLRRPRAGGGEVKSGLSGRKRAWADTWPLTTQQDTRNCPKLMPFGLILNDTFSFFEHLQGLSQAVPQHTTGKTLDPSHQKKLMLGDQHQLVHFSIKSRHVERITHVWGLMSRLQVHCSWRPPLSSWAGWVLDRILSCHSFLSHGFTVSLASSSA